MEVIKLIYPCPPAARTCVSIESGSSAMTGIGAFA
jgi:hypothetical protein